MDAFFEGAAVNRFLAHLLLVFLWVVQTWVNGPLAFPFILLAQHMNPSFRPAMFRLSLTALIWLWALYLCAGATAGDLCDTARLEWLDSVVVDTTRSEPVAVGELSGVTGTVRSWMYDLGLSSQLTRETPFVLDAAKELGDASFALEGIAVVAGIDVAFQAFVPIQQTEDTELGVPVIRKGSSDSFYREIDGSEQSLLVRFDASTWVASVDFRSFVTNDLHQRGPEVVCESAVEHTCEMKRFCRAVIVPV